MFSISFRKFSIEEKKITVLFDYQNVNSFCWCHHYVNSSCCFYVCIKFQYKSTSVLSRMPFSDWLCTYHLFCCRSWVVLQCAVVNKMTAAPGVFEVSVERIKIKFETTSRFILRQLEYSLLISMRDSWRGLHPRRLSRNRNFVLVI